MDTTGLLKKYCMQDSLATCDPYDIWFSGAGRLIKTFYNSHRFLALPWAALLTICDQSRIFAGLCQPREYPIVRALAAQILLNIFRKTADAECLHYARKHLEWLLNNKGECSSQAGWGIPVSWPVSKGLIYPPTMTLATVTPYCLEAFYKYEQISGNDDFAWLYPRFKEYFTNDLKVMFESPDELRCSYSHTADRVVANANSYTLFSLALLSHILNDRESAASALKIYNFIRRAQRTDGAWFYTYDDPGSFIDCFHSCFILKNLKKAARYIELPEVEKVIERGWEFIKNNMFDSKHDLFVRFAVSNKFNTTKFDLYDNAEALNIAIMLNDISMQEKLLPAIEKTFLHGDAVYSKITPLNIRYGKNHLRWAVMPYLYALSKLI